MATPRRLLCLTITGYKKGDLDEAEFCHHQVNKNAYVLSDLMKECGAQSYTIIHNTKKTHSLLSKLFDPARIAFDDHDHVVQIFLPDIDSFLKIKENPLYIQHLSHLAEYTDTTNEHRKPRVSLSFVHEVIRDGQVLYVEDKDTIACEVYNNSFNGETGNFMDEA
ncbi:hypothetical protein BDV25DRAFT_139361 [Aspergillus avenaceus]|uniref:EthD domain-containing protein n=1 Tax=Aspergillus avenaceus TaxID=36643 RepID=A0A5N6TX14_ASPAV|nr:hypothetical protein BDV25DRAFT_139361 [Aspergillus avenaceus]